MASSTDSLFFKKEDSNLTVEKLREMNYLAKETSKGFILVGLFHDLRQRQLNYYSEWEFKEDYKELVKLLSDNLKENAPPIMRLNSSTFGGCFDDEPSLKVYNSEGEKVKVFVGKDKGKDGEIIEIDRSRNLAKVKAVNMQKKHKKPTKENKGGIVSKEGYVHLSNLRKVEDLKKKVKKWYPD